MLNTLHNYKNDIIENVICLDYFLSNPKYQNNNGKTCTWKP